MVLPILDSLAYILHFTCGTFRDIFKFLLHEMKNVYYASITEISHLFILECEEHASLDESSGGSKCT